jgi:hypothetical protein
MLASRWVKDASKTFGVKDIMKTTVKWAAAAALVGIPLAGIAQQPALSCVRDITYSQEFLAKYPRAGAACNEVVIAKGQKWARFNAKVKTRQGTHLSVDFVDNDGRPVGAAMTFEFTPDATVTLKNKEMKPVAALEEGDKVVFWMPEKRMGFYAQPGAVESEHFALVSNDSAKQ